MSNAKVPVAVVGLGVGRAHIEGFKSLPEMYEVVAVCDVNEDKARQVAAQFNIPRVYTSFDELCRRDDLEVVDICTPPFLHFGQIQHGLAAGKHVISEKPLVRSLREVDELVVAQAQSGKYLMPIFQKRFGNGLQKLKLLIAEGLTGKAYLTTVETQWRRRAEYYAVPWRGKWQTELGGTLLGHAIHAHDMLTYALGPVKSVFARATTRVNPIETEDCAVVSLEMADGSLAGLSATTGSAIEMSRARFCFSNLVAESNTDAYNHSHDPWLFKGDTPELDAQIQAALARFEPQPERFVGQFYRFYHTLRDSAPLPVTLDDARQSLELISAMYYSARVGQPVELPIGPDHPYYNGWLPNR